LRQEGVGGCTGGDAGEKLGDVEDRSGLLHGNE
jgi:hypothetical protein